MAKKSKKVSVEDVELEALIHEGKNLDIEKVDEIIQENKAQSAEDEIKEEEKEETETEEQSSVSEEYDNDQKEPLNDSEESVDVEELIQEAKETEADEIIKVTEETDSTTDDSNIDDVISECTGNVEHTKEPKKSEPWYVARAKRMGDYYNW